MAIKGEKLSAETRAKISAATKARWDRIKAAEEHVAMHSVSPRCAPVKRSVWQIIKGWLS